jgi:hypothetical protein
MGLAIGGPIALITYGSIKDAIQSGQDMHFSLDNFTTDVPPAQLAQVCVPTCIVRVWGGCLCACDTMRVSGVLCAVCCVPARACVGARTLPPVRRPAPLSADVLRCW